MRDGGMGAPPCVRLRRARNLQNTLDTSRWRGTGAAQAQGRSPRVPLLQRDPNLPNDIMVSKTLSNSRDSTFEKVAGTTTPRRQKETVLSVRRDSGQYQEEMFAKPGALPREEMLGIQVRNTTLHLNGQNLRLEAKNGRNSKTPGLHLSSTHGKEAAGQLTGCLQTQEGSAQSDLLPHKSPRPEPERKAENQPARRPVKLAPLELTEEVREAQRQKMEFIQQEAKPASCGLEGMENEPCARRVKSCVRQRPVKDTDWPSGSAAPLKAQHQNRPTRPQLIRCSPIEQSGNKNLEDVVCQGTPAPLCSKPAPPSLSSRVKVRAARGAELVRQNPNPLQQEVGTRRLRLRRAKCLEEDQCNSNVSTVGLCADKAKPAQGVQSKGQRAEKALKAQPHPGKSSREPLGEFGSIRQSHKEGCSQLSERCTLNRQSAEGSSKEQALEGVKPNAANWRLKRRKPLITKNNNAVPLERLQL